MGKDGNPGALAMKDLIAAKARERELSGKPNPVEILPQAIREESIPTFTTSIERSHATVLFTAVITSDGWNVCGNGEKCPFQGIRKFPNRSPVVHFFSESKRVFLDL